MRGLVLAITMLMTAFAPASAISFLNTAAAYFGINLSGLLAMPGSSGAIIPEPLSWGLAIAGVAVAGAALRRKRQSLPRTTA